jgi:membrane-associated phospholipid phosphatase
MNAHEKSWRWPRWDVLRSSLVVGLGVALWFVLVYVGTDVLAARHTYRARLHFEAELRLPFLPAMVLGYLSIYPLFWSAPFILRNAREIRALGFTLAVVIFVGGIGFVLLPADVLYPPSPELGIWAAPVRFARQVALRHNFIPSLHVALSAVCAFAYAEHAGPVGKLTWGPWSLVIALSTLLLHQHYVVDVVAGYVVAWAGFRWVYQARLRHSGAMASAAKQGRSYVVQSKGSRPVTEPSRESLRQMSFSVHQPVQEA